jgi:DNA-binding NarL/FixJ family response regulator
MPMEQTDQRENPVVIDIIFADDQELFRTGAAEILSGENDVRIVAQPASPQQLLSALETLTPHILVLSTSFLPAFWKIEPLMKRGQTALLMLAEEGDHTAYVRWLRAQGIVYRSMDGPVLIDALRRVARGELFVQSRNFDMRIDPSEVA